MPPCSRASDRRVCVLQTMAWRHCDAVTRRGRDGRRLCLPSRSPSYPELNGINQPPWLKDSRGLAYTIQLVKPQLRTQIGLYHSAFESCVLARGDGGSSSHPEPWSRNRGSPKGDGHRLRRAQGRWRPPWLRAPHPVIPRAQAWDQLTRPQQQDGLQASRVSIHF